MKQQLNNTTSPLVSIIMPVYNAEAFISSALDSIVNQTYKNWELIVVNDCSTDSSLEILNSYKKRYPRKVKIINLNTNLNAGGDVATNLGIPYAKGDYIAKMDADDISHPRRLEKQVAYLNEHPEISLVGSNATVINIHGHVIGSKHVPLTNAEIYREYIYFHPMIHPTIMFRRTLIKRKSFYKIKFNLANDYFTLFSLICSGHKFANLEEELLMYRIYGKNSSLKNIKKGIIAAMKVKFAILKKYKYPITPMVIIKNLVQAMTAMLLPQRVSFYLYMLAKGIMTKEEVFGDAVDALRVHFTAIKKRLGLAFS